MAEMPETVSQAKSLNEILAEYESAVDAGKNPDPRAYVKRYPEHREELKKFFADEGCIDKILSRAGGPPGGAFEPPMLPDLAAFGALEEIDRGGIGVVYRGKDPQLPRDLAIKVLRPDRQQPYLVRRFIEEAKITGKLQHPGVVPVHNLGQMPDGRPYFTMKLIRGQTLAALLAGRASPSQDLPRFLKIFEQVCQTLAYAHSQEIVHRDLKPANIMVGHFAEVQVMDWGFAKVLRTPDDQQPATAEMHGVNVDYAKTQPGQVMGTLSYMPPEQARGEVNRVDERSDVFSLGAILCAILTDKPPYLGTTAEQLLAMAQGGDLAEARKRLDLALQSGAETELIALAWRCLSPNREDRPGNAGEVAEAVAEYQAGVQERLRAAELARTAAQAKAGEERKRRRLSVVLAAAVVLIVLGSSGAALWYIDDQARQEREALLQQVESARKKDAAAQDVRQNLTQAQKIHDKLIEELKKRGGVQNLLKSRWDLRIQSARDAWKLAKDRADNAEGSLDPELVELLKKLDGDLARDQRDYDLAWRLEKIHLDTATIVEGKFNYALAEREYPLAFAEAGLALEPGRLKETARLIQQSVIKEQLLAALDHWISTPGPTRCANWPSPMTARPLKNWPTRLNGTRVFWAGYRRPFSFSCLLTLR